MKKILIWTLVPALAGLIANLASGATIPAGTTLVVRTLETIRSVDAIGTPVSTQLVSDVTVNGKVVLRAGTKVSGKVVSSKRTYSSTQKLKVDITEAIVGGRVIPVKTTGAVQLDATGLKTRNGVSISRAGYAVAAGRVIQFRLAQPLQF